MTETYQRISCVLHRSPIVLFAQHSPVPGWWRRQRERFGLGGMMSLLQIAESVLLGTNYDVGRTGRERPSVYFEDYSLFGLLVVYDSVSELIADWRKEQDVFLNKHAPLLRNASQKAWNCYTVHLTSASATLQETEVLISIEEDFASTRKIARGSIITTADMIAALLPVLPIQNPVSMTAESAEDVVKGRLKDW